MASYLVKLVARWFSETSIPSLPNTWMHKGIKVALRRQTDRLRQGGETEGRQTGAKKGRQKEVTGEKDRKRLGWGKKDKENEDRLGQESQSAGRYIGGKCGEKGDRLG